MMVMHVHVMTQLDTRNHLRFTITSLMTKNSPFAVGTRCLTIHTTYKWDTTKIKNRMRVMNELGLISIEKLILEM